MSTKADILKFFGNDYGRFFERYLIGCQVGPSGEGKAKCPCHKEGNEEKPSLTFNCAKGVYYCQACGAKGDFIGLYQKRHGVDFAGALRGIATDFGINGAGKEKQGGGSRIVAEYDYTDADGTVLFQTCRMEPKDFRQRRPDGAGGWVWNLKGVQTVLYRLAEVLNAQQILIPEGEKDADALRALGFTATCNPMGAGKWRAHYSDALQGKDVFIFPDSDEPGRKHTADIARSLKGKAASVKLVELPDLPEKGDVSDFIAQFKGDRAEAAESIRFFIKIAKDYDPGPADATATPGEVGKKTAPTPGGDTEPEKEKQADALIRIGKQAELFQTPDGSLWARFESGGHFESWPIRAKGSGYRRWLVSQFYQETGTAPTATAVQSSVDVLEAEAQFGANRSAREVFTRVAGYEGAIYLDLADDAWRACKITAEGWEVIAAPPVCFRRTRGMLPLPEPVRGGSLRLLDSLINLGSDENRKLILSWLVYCLNPSGPYPLLGFVSEQGSGKSTTAKLLRMTIDPNQAPIRALPKSLEDLAVAAQHSWVLSFDNLSFIADTFSDALCRMATGGGFATRALWTIDEEAVFWAKRPTILNGISEFAGRPDLLERALIVHLPTIPPEKRQTEGAIMAAFEKVRPALLGAVLDAAVLALKNLSCVTISEYPRMADFAQWAAAAAPAIEADPGELVGLLLDKQDEALLSELDAPLPQAVFELLEARAGKYEGLLSDLLTKLGELAGEDFIRQNSWPQSPRALRNALARVAPVMRVAGVRFAELGRTNKGRQVILERDDTVSKRDDRRPKVTKRDDSGPSYRHGLNVQKRGESDETTPKRDDSDGSTPYFSLPSTPKKKEEKGEKEKGERGGEGEKEKVAAIPSLSSHRHALDLLEGEL